MEDILAMVFGFFVVMGLISIPIIAIVKRKSRFTNDAVLLQRIESLEKKVSELEKENLDQKSSIYEVQNDVKFLNKLLDSKHGV